MHFTQKPTHPCQDDRLILPDNLLSSALKANVNYNRFLQPTTIISKNAYIISYNGNDETRKLINIIFKLIVTIIRKF